MHGAQTQKSKGQKSKGKRRLAEGADRYALYRLAVQDPEHEVKQFLRFYKDSFGNLPVTLREDFCAAAAVCCEWVKGNPDRRAVGVDLDPEPLKYGMSKYLSRLKPHEQERVRLLNENVLSCTARAHVIAAQNYSFFLFKTRELLLKYFQAAHACLEDEGILILDVMGGGALHNDGQSESRQVARETPEDKLLPPFRYVWEQERFNPITHDVLFHIHFRFPDGSAIERAFTYDWRLWSVPEIRELLAEAGFSKVHVYWETLDKDGNLSNNYRRASEGRNDETWLAYVVAER